MRHLTIGKLAKATGVGVDTIRYYERNDILPPPERLPSGYRVYTNENIRKLRFLKEAQSLGFTLQEIRELLSMTEDPEADCARVNTAARTKLVQIEAKIKLLRKIRKNLLVLADYCPANEMPLSECNIINHLYGDT